MFLYLSLLGIVGGSLLLSYCRDKTLLPRQLINESLIGVKVPNLWQAAGPMAKRHPQTGGRTHTRFVEAFET